VQCGALDLTRCRYTRGYDSTGSMSFERKLSSPASSRQASCKKALVEKKLELVLPGVGAAFSLQPVCPLF